MSTLHESPNMHYKAKACRCCATPLLSVRNVPAAIDFYARAFGAVERFRLTDAEGKVVHAEITVGETLLMLVEEHPEYNVSPETLGNSTVVLNLAVAHADAVVAQAVAAGATCIFPVADQFYGERAGRIRDPFGHIWIVSTHIEDVSPEEMQRRFDVLCEG